MLQLVSCHEIKNIEIGFKKFGTELRRVVALHQILAGKVISDMFGTTKQGRDDIIVKVNIQSLISASFSQ